MSPTINDKPFIVRFNVRHVRIAYFVPSDDPAAMKEALQIASTQWGGIYHLIIPWPGTLIEGTSYPRWLKLMDPDRFVAFLNDSEAIKQLSDELTAILPNRKVVVEHGPTFVERDKTQYALHSLTKDERGQCHVRAPKGLANNELEELLNLAVFGDAYPGQEEDYEPLLIREPFSFYSDDFWKSQFHASPFSSIINLTSYRTNIKKVSDLISFGGIREFDNFTLVLVDSLASLCLYWNVRAIQEIPLFNDVRGTDRRVICVPLSILRNRELFQQLFLEIKERLYFPGRTADIDVFLVSLDNEIYKEAETIIHDLELAQLFEKKTFKGNTIAIGNPSSSISTQQGLSRDIISYLKALPPEPSSFYDGIKGTATSITLFDYGPNNILVERPSGYVLDDRGEIVLVIESDVWQRYPIRPPIEGVITPSSRLTPNGLSMRITMPRTLNLDLPDERSTMLSAFRQDEYDVEQSKIGQYSDALIALVGGISGLGIFAQARVVKLLYGMASLSTRKLAQKLFKEISQDDASSITNIYPESGALETALQRVGLASNIDASPKSLQQIISLLRSSPSERIRNEELLQIIEQLCLNKVLQRGYYVGCPNCGKNSWYSLSSVAEHITCSGCYHEFHLPILESSSQTLQWRYRLNPLVDQVLDQDLLVGLLAVYHISGKGRAATFGHTFGLNVLKRNMRLTDLDFAFVMRQLILAGECKSGSVLTGKDFHNAELAASLGCNRFYFCTLTEFDKNTSEAIESFRAEFENTDDRKLLVLQGSDLLSAS